MTLDIVSKELTENYKNIGAKEHIFYHINGCKSKRILRKN